VCVNSHLPVAHHFNHALRLSDSNFVISSHQKLEHRKTASFLSNFEILKFVKTAPKTNSDVVIRVDTFSYKKLFYPTSYAKVMAVLPIHKVFL
jgi:hypothetical protein